MGTCTDGYTRAFAGSAPAAAPARGAAQPAFTLEKVYRYYPSTLVLLTAEDAGDLLPVIWPGGTYDVPMKPVTPASCLAGTYYKTFACGVHMICLHRC